MEEELKKIAQLVAEKTLLCNKEVLTSDEAAQYMGVSKSTLYKWTMGRVVPHYKPQGKLCFFNRLELEKWLQSNRVSTNEELNDEALAYCMKGGRK